jgi:hypothetical protein
MMVVTMKKMLFLAACSALMSLSIAQSALATDVTFEVSVHGTSDKNFDEFKVEGSSDGEKATGHIVNDGTVTYPFTFDTRKNDQIWVWIDTLRAPADLTIKVDNIPVFHGYCVPDFGRMSGERNIFEACAANQTARSSKEGKPYFSGTSNADSFLIFK